MANIPTGKVVRGEAGAVLSSFPDDCVDCVVTSPPYWGQRDYGIDHQTGVEDEAQEYVDTMVSVFDELRRVCADSASLWLNIGDTYNGCSIVRKHNTSTHPRKGDESYEAQLSDNRDDSGVMRRSSAQWGLKRQSRMMIPSRVAMGVCDLGYRLRDEIVWYKTDPKPEGRVSTRLTQSHEKIYRFVLSEDNKFYRDRADDTTNVWEIPTASGVDHPAPFPRSIPERCIELTTDPGDVVLDPFAGSGTTLQVADTLDREYIGIDINPQFADEARKKLTQ